MAIQCSVARFFDWDCPLDLIPEFTSERSEGIGAYILSPRYFSEFEELKVLGECLDEFEVDIHLFVAKFHSLRCTNSRRVASRSRHEVALP